MSYAYHHLGRLPSRAAEERRLEWAFIDAASHALCDACHAAGTGDSLVHLDYLAAALPLHEDDIEAGDRMALRILSKSGFAYVGVGVKEPLFRRAGDPTQEARHPDYDDLADRLSDLARILMLPIYHDE